MLLGRHKQEARNAFSCHLYTEPWYYNSTVIPTFTATQHCALRSVPYYAAIYNGTCTTKKRIFNDELLYAATFLTSTLFLGIKFLTTCSLFSSKHYTIKSLYRKERQKRNKAQHSLVCSLRPARAEIFEFYPTRPDHQLPESLRMFP
jgi:hypothetical protein